MKRLIPIVLLLLLLVGCKAEEDYLSVRPHVEQPTQGDPSGEADPIPVVTNRLELRGAILSLIDNWKEQGQVLIQDYEGDVAQNLSEIMDYATRQHPTGAYAVDYADAEIIEEEGQQLVQVSFVFRRSLSEINSIVLVDDSDAAQSKITEALSNYSTALTLRIRRYSNRDFERDILRYCMENPRVIPTIPEFSLKLYPEEGDHRIMEIHFTYPESKDVMREKLLETDTTFRSALIYGQGGNTPENQAKRLCNYLIRRHDQTLTDTVPVYPLYSLFSENIGHDLSYAMCYHDLCASLGITSHIIEGTKNGDPYYWNLLVLEDKTYHVDLRRYVEQGSNSVIPLYDETLLAEGYVWDRDAYPAAPDPSIEPTEGDGNTDPTAPTPSSPEAPAEGTETTATESETTVPEASQSESTAPSTDSDPTTPSSTPTE